jgi:CRISPR system Cascade subunit CasC
MADRAYVDIHLVQTVPPSCINRDDTGSPKTAVYGGATRARVSSQAWKRAVRTHFMKEGLYALDDLGARTKQIVALVAEEMRRLPGCPEDPETLAKKLLIAAGLQEKTVAAGKDAPLFFLSAAQAKAVAQLAVDHPDADKKAARNALKSAPSVDLALFGRMVADEANLNIDASCQVAHAISTHAVVAEYDYFTAVDDNPPEDKTDAGAAMIGTVEFNSATLYRYATIAVHDLCGQLGGAEQAATAVRAFTDAFARSMPTGKQNTFANRTLPVAALVCVRRDQPVNLVGAFERPVVAPQEGGMVAQSIRRLADHANATFGDWVAPAQATFVTGDGMDAVNGACKVAFPELLSKLETTIREALG